MSSSLSRLGRLSSFLRRFFGTAGGPGTLPISPLKRIGGAAAALLTVIGVAIGWPEAMEAWRAAKDRDIEEYLALDLQELITLGASPDSKEARPKKPEANELRKKLRDHCADGIPNDPKETKKIRDWAAERPYNGPHPERYKKLLALAEGNEQLYPPGLAAFVAQERQRLCDATNAVREGVRRDKEGQTDAAREKFLEATRLDDQNLSAWVNLAKTLNRLGRPNQAKEALDHTRGLEKSPAEAFAVQYNLAAYLAQVAGNEAAARLTLVEGLEAYHQAEADKVPTSAALYDLLKTDPEFELLRAAGRFPDDLNHPALAGTPAGPKAGK